MIFFFLETIGSLHKWQPWVGFALTLFTVLPSCCIWLYCTHWQLSTFDRHLFKPPPPRPTSTHVWGPRHPISSRCWTELGQTQRRKRWRPSRKYPPFTLMCVVGSKAKKTQDPSHLLSPSSNGCVLAPWSNQRGLVADFVLIVPKNDLDISSYVTVISTPVSDGLVVTLRLESDWYPVSVSDWHSPTLEQHRFLVMTYVWTHTYKPQRDGCVETAGWQLKLVFRPNTMCILLSLCVL